MSSSTTGFGATPTGGATLPTSASASASAAVSASTSKRPPSPSLVSLPNRSEGGPSGEHLPGAGAGGGSGGERPGKKSKGTPGPKARIPAEAKVIIAVEIINRGIAALNIDELVISTGLSKQQIKSQLVDNRQNVRRQLIELARGLQ